jgi:nucleotide-binding universal stress UspA family protein
MTRSAAECARESIRSVLVHLDGGAAAAERLRVACSVGRCFDAEVFAMFCADSTGPSLQLAISESPAALLETQDWAALHRAQALFEEDGSPLPRRTWLDSTGVDAPHAFLRQARSADLVVLGTVGSVAEVGVATRDLLEAVLMRGGRPLLLVPPGEPTWRDGADVLVGWNGSPQSARALAAALPWLHRARHVHVLVSQEECDLSDGDGLDMRGALRRHGIETVIHRDRGVGEGAGQRLVACAAQVGAGLLVMGGFGHGRWRERALGGATAFILGSTPLPVLMVH